MGKLLFLIVLAAVAWILWRGLRARRSSGPPPRRQRAVESMVVCAHCGVNVPHSESLSDGRQHYCSLEHQRAADADRAPRA
jgi:uncharacterized protein